MQLGEAAGKLIAPFAGTGAKFIPEPWGTGQVPEDVQSLLNALGADESPPDTAASPNISPSPSLSVPPVSGSGVAPGGGGASGSGGCTVCSKDEDCESFFVSVCNSCGRSGARCEEYPQVGLCCQCPRCITTDSGSP